MYVLRVESEYSAVRSVRPWKPPLTTSRLTLRPACLAPSSVMALVLVSAMRAASETDSEPEFRHMKLANGQPPMLWPISLRRAPSARRDRKRVVSGKSGSVRVDHGGGRYLKKKIRNR